MPHLNKSGDTVFSVAHFTNKNMISNILWPIRKTSSTCWRPCILSELPLEHILLIKILQMITKYPYQLSEWTLYLSSFAPHTLVTLASFLCLEPPKCIPSPDPLHLLLLPLFSAWLVSLFLCIHSGVTALVEVLKTPPLKTFLLLFLRAPITLDRDLVHTISPVLNIMPCLWVVY